MYQLSRAGRAKMIACLVEGNSIRATARMTGFAFNTVLRFARDIGRACAEYQWDAMTNLPCKRIQCDEIWQFVYAKQKNVPESMKGTFGVGGVWTWTAICADTKLVPCWFVGDRSAASASLLY
jgi:hypothetical protein